MTLKELIEWAEDKTRFQNIDDYSMFCEAYLNFFLMDFRRLLYLKMKIIIAFSNIEKMVISTYHGRSILN